MAKKINSPLVFIFVTVFIDCIGIRVVYPVAASLITEVSGLSLSSGIEYNAWLMATYSLMQFLFSPLLGALSDRFGRRPVLLFSLVGLGVNYFFQIFANSLLLLFIGRIIAGICGATLTTCFAYTADISTKENRAQNFGLLGAAIGIGFILGPLLGGLFSEISIRAPFFVASCLSVLNLIYGYFLLPESLNKKNKRTINLRRANPCGAFIHFRKNKKLRNLLLALFLLYMATQVLPSIWPFYTKYMFSWSDLEIGYSLTFVGIMLSIVKGGLIKFIQHKLGSFNTILLGLSFSIIGLILFSVASLPWQLYVIAFLYSIGGIASPSLQGFIANNTADYEQGELQGFIASLISLSHVVSPLLMSNLFYHFTQENTLFFFPGISFLTAAVVNILALFLFINWRKKNEKMMTFR